MLRTPLLATLLALAARPLGAQGDAAALPTCESLGRPAIAVMGPPDADREQVRSGVRASGAVPEGMEVRVIGMPHAPPMLNQREVRVQLVRALNRLAYEGFAADGEAVSIVMLDVEGAVGDVLPGSGNADVDRVLRVFWRRPRFAPPVVDGCRAPAWVRVPLRFSIRPDETRVQVEYPALPDSRR